LEQVILQAVTTAREIASLMAAMNQQAASADTPTAAIAANQVRIDGLEAQARKVHDDLLASGRFDAVPKERVAAQHLAELESQVRLATQCTDQGVKAKQFQGFVLADAARDLNGVLVYLRAGAKQTPATAESAPAGGEPSTTAAPATGQAVNYDGPGAVASTGLSVTAATPLDTGMLVLVQSSGGWYAADVLEVMADGTVKVHYRGWDSQYDELVPRERIQLVSTP
jgi:hypothetical protein